MRELVQIASLSEHACGQPSIERWHVFEPVSGRWSWMRVFRCCDQVITDIADEDGSTIEVKKAA